MSSPAPEYHELRMQVFCRDGWRCQWPGCGRRSPLELHHILLRSSGGLDEPANLTTLCRRHHNQLHRALRAMKLESPLFWGSGQLPTLQQ